MALAVVQACTIIEVSRADARATGVHAVAMHARALDLEAVGVGWVDGWRAAVGATGKTCCELDA